MQDFDRKGQRKFSPTSIRGDYRRQEYDFMEDLRGDGF